MNLGTRMQQPPLTSMEWMDTPRPKPWNTGITESIVIPASGLQPLASTVCRPRALKLRLESRIPLLVPVVPP